MFNLLTDLFVNSYFKSYCGSLIHFRQIYNLFLDPIAAQVLSSGIKACLISVNVLVDSVMFVTVISKHP